MDRITVWTKQHEDVAHTLSLNGRYVVKKEYIAIDLDEHADIVLEAYDWLSTHSPDAKNRPADVQYPVWVTYSSDRAMLKGKNSVVIELSVPPALITPINIAKWGAILNYSYIPLNEEDKKRHSELLNAYGVSDAKAYMSQFYPDIKREIADSWLRLFDDSILMGNELKYGNIWEIRSEWVTKIIR